MPVREQTAEAMDSLRRLGFPDDLFPLLHHMGVTRQAHYEWASDRPRGAGGENPTTCDRLRCLVREARRTNPGCRGDWLELVRQARAQVPRSDGVRFPVSLPRQ